MPLKQLLNIILCFLFLATRAQSHKKPNIINYFASNNQIVGSPMIDLDNHFRFYPDLNLQEAITGIEVYYFVENDVYKHHLARREEGQYWETKLRDFVLGEAIQRVEVVVDYTKEKLDGILRNQYNIDTQINFNYYLLLRRGDDKSLYKLKYTDRLIDLTATSASEVKEYYSKIDKTTAQISGALATADKALAEKLNIAENAMDVQQLKKLQDEQLNKIVTLDTVRLAFQKALYEKERKALDTANNRSSDLIIKAVENQVGEDYFKKIATLRDLFSEYQSSLKNWKPTNVPIPDDLFREQEYELLKNVAGQENLRLYSAYVENRLASMLDIRFKSGDDKTLQFIYRNDKLSLQYLQAGDPQEKLGIFRARLVPFTFYRTTQADGTLSDFSWQRSRVIYEIGVNFGYAIVKGDHFTPKFFDMNRLGLGIGIASDTFSDNPTFLSISLTYDVNTYTSIAFGANLIAQPCFYMGIGINARAFKDLVKQSGALFRKSN